MKNDSNIRILIFIINYYENIEDKMTIMALKFQL